MLDGQDHARQKWTLTQDAFDRLLIAFGGNRESGSEKYLEIRGNLTRFFEWRGCSFPEDHADETVNRVARRLAQGEKILNPSAYFIGVARLQMLEIVKARAKESQALSEMASSSEEAVDSSASEDRIECLQRCLQEL